MATKKEIEGIFARHGVRDYRWIDAKKIVVAQWVRMKCTYGCPEYGHTATCPPNTPSVEECERFFHEYRRAIAIHYAKRMAKPADRHRWTRRLNLKLLDLERDVFRAGHERAFLLFMDSCNLCRTCAGTRAGCKEPWLARPTPDALAMDVYTTVRRAGYPIEVLAGYQETMNRYAFLMVD